MVRTIHRALAPHLEHEDRCVACADLKHALRLGKPHDRVPHSRGMRRTGCVSKRTQPNSEDKMGKKTRPLHVTHSSGPMFSVPIRNAYSGATAASHSDEYRSPRDPSCTTASPPFPTAARVFCGDVLSSLLRTRLSARMRRAHTIVRSRFSACEAVTSTIIGPAA